MYLCQGDLKAADAVYRNAIDHAVWAWGTKNQGPVQLMINSAHDYERYGHYQKAEQILDTLPDRFLRLRRADPADVAGRAQLLTTCCLVADDRARIEYSWRGRGLIQSVVETQVANLKRIFSPDARELAQIELWAARALLAYGPASEALRYAQRAYEMSLRCYPKQSYVVAVASLLFCQGLTNNNRGAEAAPILKRTAEWVLKAPPSLELAYVAQELAGECAAVGQNRLACLCIDRATAIYAHKLDCAPMEEQTPLIIGLSHCQRETVGLCLLAFQSQRAQEMLNALGARYNGDDGGIWNHQFEALLLTELYVLAAEGNYDRALARLQEIYEEVSRQKPLGQREEWVRATIMHTYETLRQVQADPNKLDLDGADLGSGRAYASILLEWASYGAYRHNRTDEARKFLESSVKLVEKVRFPTPMVSWRYCRLCAALMDKLKDDRAATFRKKAADCARLAIGPRWQEFVDPLPQDLLAPAGKKGVLNSWR